MGGEMGEAVLERRLDFYREICCAMGSEAERAGHAAAARGAGSRWTKDMLGKVFKAFSEMPFSVRLLKRCDFLDFGASRSLIESGRRLVQEEQGLSSAHTLLEVNNEISQGGSVKGTS